MAKRCSPDPTIGSPVHKDVAKNIRNALAKRMCIGYNKGASYQRRKESFIWQKKI